MSNISSYQRNINSVRRLNCHFLSSMKNNTQLKGDLDHVQEVNEDSQDYILKDLQKDLESQMNLLDSINQSLDKQAKKKKLIIDLTGQRVMFDYESKIIKLDEPKEKDNALNEVRLLASIDSPNIISYKTAFFQEAGNTLCILMEYADGGDLAVPAQQNRTS